MAGSYGGRHGGAGHDVSGQPRLKNGQFTFVADKARAEMAAKQTQAALNAPMPVSPDAPLEERMYAESVADVVKRHSQKDHSELKPYTAEPNAAVPYYRMGVRPLDSDYVPKNWYGTKSWVMGQHWDHMHFVGSDGSNFGLTRGGTFAEEMEKLNTYLVEAPKYRKEYIDRARAEIDKEDGPIEIFHTQQERDPYNLLSQNCQHYFARVLQKAKQHETKAKPLVLP
ncbi:MAG: hypothetical protein QM579_00275 [Desulfovibrio sp.]|uniref:hypothetical protein n=1 Tax=Desulfovibrio sp. TaxID=885 RepID=UPI0039E2E1B5